MRYILIFDQGSYESVDTNIIALKSISIIDAEQESMLLLKNKNAFHSNSSIGDSAIIYEISNEIYINISEKRDFLKEETARKRVIKKEEQEQQKYEKLKRKFE